MMQFPSPDYRNQNKPPDPMQTFMQLMAQKQQMDQRKQERDEDFKNKMKLMNDEFKKNKELKQLQYDLNMKQFEAEQDKKTAQEQQQFEQSVIRAQTGADVMEQGIRSQFTDSPGRRPMPGESFRPLTPQGEQMQSMMPVIRGGAAQGQNIPVNQIMQTPMNPLQKTQMDKINREMNLLFKGDPESPQFKARFPGAARIEIAEEKNLIARDKLKLLQDQFGLDTDKFELETQQILNDMTIDELNAVTRLAEKMAGDEDFGEEHLIKGIEELAALFPKMFGKYAAKIVTQERRFLSDKKTLQKPGATEQEDTDMEQFFK